ncbi:MAG: M20/M25/M40 family metallo-hydrolase, partial [Planctomycetales bacterium]|nr:M20/M25/M40 family metallo-hydrolase [Planctomycetales bacterium]
SRELGGWQVAGRIELGRETSSLKNVVATIETTGPLAEQTVIVGAHYDHLGYGGGWGSLAPWTRDVHNGADDNASGTTVMIEVARQLAQRRDPLKRRVMFIAFTAEESG